VNIGLYVIRSISIQYKKIVLNVGCIIISGGGD
jgi:hypothetical protein